MTNAASAQDSGVKLPPSAIARVLWIVLGILVTLSIAISFAGRWFGHSISMGGHTDAARPFEVVIGNNVIVAPANAIRFDHARRDGVAQRLDLYLRWPGLTGYSDAHAGDFNNIAGEKRIIFAAFEPRIMSRDMSGRLEPIYRGLIEPVGRVGPGGTTVYAFTAKSGYVNEELVTGARSGQTPFVARCLTGQSAAQSLAECQRDVDVGDGLSLSYRFPAALLPEWRKVDEAVVAAARSMLRTARN